MDAPPCASGVGIEVNKASKDQRIPEALRQCAHKLIKAWKAPPGHESETTIQDACIQDGGIVLRTRSCSDATATYDDDSLSDSDSISDSG